MGRQSLFRAPFQLLSFAPQGRVFVGHVTKKLLWCAVDVIKEYYKQDNKITENMLKIYEK